MSLSAGASNWGRAARSVRRKAGARPVCLHLLHQTQRAGQQTMPTDVETETETETESLFLLSVKWSVVESVIGVKWPLAQTSGPMQQLRSNLATHEPAGSKGDTDYCYVASMLLTCTCTNLSRKMQPHATSKNFRIQKGRKKVYFFNLNY